MSKLNIAMLSAQVPSSPEAVNLDDNLPNATNEVEGGLDELNIAMQDLESIDDAITQAVDASIELKVEQETVEQAQQQGQTSQVALESIQRNVNRMLDDVGITARATFAFEGFNNPHYNSIAMESAVQSIKDFLVRIWEAIKKAFQKVKDVIVTIYKKLFDESLKVKKRADALAKKALGLQGRMAPAGIKVGSFSLSTYMRLNNAPLKPSELVANYDTWSKQTHDLIENIAGSEAIKEYKEYVAKSVKVLQQANTHKNPDKASAEIDEVHNELLGRLFSQLPNKKTLNGDDIHQSKVVLGDVLYTFREKDMEFAADKTSDYKEIATIKTHELLGVIEAHDLCEKISKHMESYSKMDSYIKDLANLEKEIYKLATESTTSKDTLEYIDNKVISRISSSTIKLFIKAIGRFGAGARHHDMQVDKAVLEWCDLSLRPL